MYNDEMKLMKRLYDPVRDHQLDLSKRRLSMLGYSYFLLTTFSEFSTIESTIPENVKSLYFILNVSWLLHTRLIY